MTSTQYYRLAETLYAQIVDGTFAVGDRLPTELQLSRETGLARGTVRRALEHLEDLGMISRRRKAGTVVTSPVPLGRYQPAAQSAADVATLTLETKLLDPEIGELTLGKALAERIGARTGSKWFAIVGTRVRRADPDDLLCWSEHYLRGDVRRTSLLRGVLTEQDASHFRTEQIIAGALLKEPIASALGAPEGSAALVITRRNFDDQGRLVSVGIHTHRADQFRISTML